jgi:MFS family permease
MTSQGGKLNLAGVIRSPELAARRAVQAACFGFFVDMFDVYLPIAVLAPALTYFIPAGLSGTTQATIFYVVFAVTLIGRPLGALIFGYFGDLLGRRQTTLVSVAGFSVVTLLIAVLPGYEAWGGFAIMALIVLRLLDGIFIGGAYTAANPLAMEYSPKDKRGLYGALIHVGYPAALLCTSLLAALMLAIAPGGDANSPYATWGWRVPFVIGAILSGVLFFYRSVGVGHQRAESEHVEGVQSGDDGGETVTDAVSARPDAGPETLCQVGRVHGPDGKREHHDECDEDDERGWIVVS